jgi:archaellum component FlaC
METIFEKNRQVVEISRIKEEIETQITARGFSGAENAQEVERLKSELDNLLAEYERLVSEKLVLFSDMLANLREMSRSNESVVCAEEEIARLKTNMDFVKRDIFQKSRMLQD